MVVSWMSIVLGLMLMLGEFRDRRGVISGRTFGVE